MKLTVSQLRKIIKEEVARTLREAAGEKQKKITFKNLKDAQDFAKKLKVPGLTFKQASSESVAVTGPESAVMAAKDQAKKLDDGCTWEVEDL